MPILSPQQVKNDLATDEVEAVYSAHKPCCVPHLVQFTIYVSNLSRKTKMGPLILNIETATSCSSVALYQGAKLLGYTEHHNVSHSDVLQGMIKEILERGTVTPKALDGIAVSKGPGSYTGLRVGTALAKGLCYGCKIPLLAVDTLQTLIESIQWVSLSKKTICCGLLDAKRGYAYSLVVNETKDILKDTHVCHVTPQTFQSWQAEKMLFLGSGADAYKQEIEKIPHATMIHGAYPQAKAMGKLAYHQFMQGAFVTLETFSPQYLSAFVQYR